MSTPDPDRPDGPGTAPDADLTDLRTALGGDPPAAVATLDQPVVDDLAQMVQDARRGQEQALLRAVDDALRIVPWPLRKVVKKVIMP